MLSKTLIGNLIMQLFLTFFLSYFSLYLFLLPWITSQIKSDDPHYFSGRTIYLGRHSKPNAIFPSI